MAVNVRQSPRASVKVCAHTRCARPPLLWAACAKLVFISSTSLSRLILKPTAGQGFEKTAYEIIVIFHHIILKATPGNLLLLHLLFEVTSHYCAYIDFTDSWFTSCTWKKENRPRHKTREIKRKKERGKMTPQKCAP